MATDILYQISDVWEVCEAVGIKTSSSHDAFLSSFFQPCTHGTDSRFASQCILLVIRPAELHTHALSLAAKCT